MTSSSIVGPNGSSHDAPDTSLSPYEPIPKTEEELDDIFGKPDEGRSIRSSITPARSRLYSISELDALPQQDWLIEEALPANALVGLIGPKGSFKTFAALDMALHVALGLEWQNRPTRRAAVAYIISEGAFGARARVDAWLSFYKNQGLHIDRNDIPIWFLPSRVPLNSVSAVARLVHDIQDQVPHSSSPELIVVDTLNRNLDGDEDGKGMTGYVAGCAQLQEAFGSSVMSVHHTPLGTFDRGRGHGAFDGAIDTRLIVSRSKDRVTLRCTHQRNGPDDWSVAFEAKASLDSLVLVPANPVNCELAGQRREALEALSRVDTASFTSWRAETGLKKPSFQKARKWLIAKAYAQLEDKLYTVTSAGRQALGILDREGYSA